MKSTWETTNLHKHIHTRERERERERELTKPCPFVLHMDWTMVYLEQYCDGKIFIQGMLSKATAILPFAFPFDKSSSHSSIDLYVLSLVLSKFISCRIPKT